MTDEHSQVFLNPEDDPAMQAAFERARASFRFFWREMTWERRRIVSGVELAVVKGQFADQPTIDMRAAPPVEHMWVSDIDFDGYFVSGKLLNSPNWVQSVKAGDLVRVPLGQISDWLYARNEAYGGFTVNLMRSRMTPAELKVHDAGWGVDFGDPERVELIPDYAAEVRKRESKRGFFGRKKQPVSPSPSERDLNAEHPMALNMVPAYTEQARSDPGVVHYRDERGWTQLHHFALGGSVVCTQFFLDHGADPRALTSSGLTAAQLAHSLGWVDVVTLLQRHGG